MWIYKLYFNINALEYKEENERKLYFLLRCVKMIKMRGDAVEYIWNPWHGCVKYSEGCRNCYVYRRDGSVGRDASEVRKNADFDLCVRKKKNGEYKIPSGSLVYVCMTSDFFLDKADGWRPEIWKMLKARGDLKFFIITKRIERFAQCIPEDWGDGYDNVAIMCTMENQRETDLRFPIFNKAMIKHKYVVCEPLLEKIDMRAYLSSQIKGVTVGGESGDMARLCDYDWVLDLREQCISFGVSFTFKQTGACFRKDGKLYHIKRHYQQDQAKKSGINT